MSKPIGIIGALPQEISALLSKLTNRKEQQRGTDTFIEGILHGFQIVTTLSGMGKVNAAATAQRLISEFNIKFLLFTGVAGGIDPNLNIGDVLIARSAFQHDYGFYGETFTNHPVGVLPEIGMGTGREPLGHDLSHWPTLTQPSNLTFDFFSTATEHLIASQSTLQSVTVEGRTYHPRIKVGTIATGDQFIANESQRKKLLDQGAHAVEMEGAAVAQIAQRNQIPCFILRAISDKAGTHSKLDFQKFFETVASNNAHLIESLFENPQLAHYLRA